MTRSVIAVMVCLETSAPYTSARCALISPWVSPFADREMTMSSTPVSRRCLLAAIFGSKLESRSLGTESSTGPVTIAGIAAITAFRIVPGIAQVIVQLAFQGALDHHLGQPAQQPAFTGQLQPAGAGPLSELAQHLLIGRRQLRPGLVPILCHVSHWCLLRLGSYTVEITAVLTGAGRVRVKSSV